jgi:hypothetical protein
MSRIRQHLTYANVISSLALFIVLTGGTAVALTGSNTVQSDDLGPGAQVKAPDVAANAVNGTDVANNSLTGADVGDDSLTGTDVSNFGGGTLTGSDILESSLGQVGDANTLDGKDSSDFLGATATAADSDKLDGIDSTGFLASGSVKKLFFQGLNTNGVSTLATVGPYTIKADCSGASVVHVRLIVNGPAGAADYLLHEVVNDSGTYTHRSAHLSIPANTDTQILDAGTVDNNTIRSAGTAMLATQTGQTMVQVDFNAFVDFNNFASGACWLFGTATMGT